MTAKFVAEALHNAETPPAMVVVKPAAVKLDKICVWGSGDTSAPGEFVTKITEYFDGIKTPLDEKTQRVLKWMEKHSADGSKKPDDKKTVCLVC